MWRKGAGASEVGDVELMLENSEVMGEEKVHAVAGKACVELVKGTSLDEVIEAKFASRGMTLENGSCESAGYNSVTYNASAGNISLWIQ